MIVFEAFITAFADASSQRLSELAINSNTFNRAIAICFELTNNMVYANTIPNMLNFSLYHPELNYLQIGEGFILDIEAK